MKKIFFWGFGIITIMTIFTMTGCATLSPVPPQFPSEFLGTWKREAPAPQNTLTITANSYRLSHQETHWVLDRVSGDIYHISWSKLRSHRNTETIRFVNNTLVIEQCGGTTPENQCGGIWIRQ